MHLTWALIGFIFVFLDLKKTSVLKLTLASSFIFNSIVAYKTPQEYPLHVLTFLGFNIVFYFLIKSILKREKKDIQKIKSLKDFKNKTALVTKDIGKSLSIDGLGLIEFENQNWSAKSIDDKEIKAGKMVEIVSRENKILNVRVLEECKK